MHLRVLRHHRYIVLDIKANAFLQHMVRNIAGTLLEIGAGKRDPSWTKQLLEGRDRAAAAMTASPHGLYLVAVDYPVGTGLEQGALGPGFLQPFP